jgi:YfiH family protein
MCDAGARTLRAPLLTTVSGLCHGFEVGLASAPGVARRESGRRAVAEALAPLGRVHFLSQVHGVEIVEAPWEGTPAGDAAVVRESGELVAVKTADCVPILLVDQDARLAAAVHAGWRGSAAGIARRAVEALVARGAEPARIVAALGPAIGVCCYEVGQEFRGRFGPDADPYFIVGADGRLRLDLRRLNQHQLEASGVQRQHVEHVSFCTACDPARLPSYRRDGRDCGRILSYVGWERC